MSIITNSICTTNKQINIQSNGGSINIGTTGSDGALNFGFAAGVNLAATSFNNPGTFSIAQCRQFTLQTSTNSTFNTLSIINGGTVNNGFFTLYNGTPAGPKHTELGSITTLDIDSTTAINIGNASSNISAVGKTINLGNTGNALADTINIGTAGTTSATAINICTTQTTGATAITMGSVNTGGTGSTTIRSGSGHLVLHTYNSGNVNITAAGGTNLVSGGVATTAGPLMINAAGAVTNGGTISFASGTGQLVINTNHIVNNGTLCTLTMPAAAAIGQFVNILGLGAGGWSIVLSGGITIDHAALATATSASSAAQYDCLYLMCTVANTGWVVMNQNGAIVYV